MASQFFFVAVLSLFSIAVQIHSTISHEPAFSFESAPSAYPFYSPNYIVPPHLIQDYSINVKIAELSALHDISEGDLYQIYQLLWQQLANSPSAIILSVLDELAAVIAQEKIYLQSLSSSSNVNSRVSLSKLKQFLSDDSPEAYANMLAYLDTMTPQLSSATSRTIQNLVDGCVPALSPEDAEILFYQLETCVRYLLANQEVSARGHTEDLR